MHSPSLVTARCFAPVILGLLFAACCTSNVTLADETAEKIYELNVSPAKEPVPALQYHLLPPREEQVPGNAVPIYLRVIHDHADGEWHRLLSEEPPRLLKFSYDDMPLDDAEKTLKTYSDVLKQISAAGLRSESDWEYVYEEDPLMTLLPDAQSMRRFARLLSVQTRYELRKEHTRAALGSVRDGLALARHVSQAPFLVNQLVGNAIADVMIADLDTVISSESAPNLYWALAELPRPVVSLERGLATESEIMLLRFPELAVPKASIDWSELAPRMRDWAVQVARLEGGAEAVLMTAQIQRPATSETLAQARTELPTIGDFSSEQVAAMSDAEVEVRYMLALHRFIYDAWRKWFSVPYVQASPHSLNVTDELRKEARRRELYPLVSLLTPLRADLTNLLASQAKSGRQIARQQAIEALRMHAAETGTLPESLDEVTVVPVPLDPATSGPFAYRLEGDAAVLDVTDLAGMQRDSIRMPVRLRLRPGK